MHSYFLLKKMREVFAMQSFSFFFNKNIGVFEILKFEVLQTFTNDIVSFEQPDPGL